MKNSVKKNNQIEKKITKISILMLVLLVISVYAFNQMELAKNKKSDIEPDIDNEKISFETKRLLVKKTSYDTDFDENLNILAEYDDMALIEYENTDEIKKDYDYFKNQEEYIVESDIEIKIADDTENNSDLIEYDNTNNPLNRIKNYDLETINETDEYLIALIDTGASENDNVVERVSVIGDTVEDDNGHGDKMVNYILSQDSGAKIISIKALDSNGKGTISSVYAAIDYAIKRGVKVINLSLSAYSGGENKLIEVAINKAFENGIIVVGSAGNNNSDADYYVPANCELAIIVGSCDEEGNRREFSNVGRSVDYNVVSNSTSEASSLMTGYISKNKLNNYNLKEVIKSTLNTGLIYEIKDIKERKGIVEDKEVSFSAQEINAVGDYILYGCIDAVQPFTAPYTGIYRLEVGGGQGGKVISDKNGTSVVATGGLGGRVVGTTRLTKGTTYYVYVGGEGQPNGRNDPNNDLDLCGLGGYNGGGEGGWGNSKLGGAGGGGATHISTINGNNIPCNARSAPSFTLSYLVVAGGGGGAAQKKDGTGDTGGAGGDTDPQGTFGSAGMKGVGSTGSNSGCGAGGGGLQGGWAYTASNTNPQHGKGGSNGVAAGVTLVTSASGSREGSGFAKITLDSIESYTVVFNKNGGSGTMSNQIIYRDISTELSNNAYTRTGYTFNSWNTKEDGSGTAYSNKQAVTNLAANGGSITLYAQWTPNSVTVTFNPNGGTVDKTTMTSKTGYPIGNSNDNILNKWNILPPSSAGADHKLTKAFVTDNNVPSGRVVKLSRTEDATTTGGYHYGGPGEQTLGETFTFSVPAKGSGTWLMGFEQNGTINTTLQSDRYVPYSKVFTTTETTYHSTIFYAQTKLASDYIQYGAPILQRGGLTALPVATRPGYTFKGWYTAASGGVQVDDANHTTIITPSSNKTYYAQWEPNTATVTIKKDGANWSSSGMKLSLYQNGSVTSFTDTNATKSGATVTWSGVPNGTYRIYASRSDFETDTIQDTGVNLVVANGVGTGLINYYTLTLTKGTGISSVNRNKAVYLKGKTANIDATVANGYTWEGWSVTSGDSPN